MFWMMAILANAPPAATQKRKGKEKLHQSTVLLDVAPSLVDMDRGLGALEDRASFVVVAHGEDCKQGAGRASGGTK